MRAPRAGDNVPEIWCGVSGWLPGPWLIKYVLSAVSGPSYVVEAEHCETGNVRTGRVFPDRV